MERAKRRRLQREKKVNQPAPTLEKRSGKVNAPKRAAPNAGNMQRWGKGQGR